MTSIQAQSDIVNDPYKVKAGANERILTENGSFLFYNSPVSVSHNGIQYYSWITNTGNVILRTINGDNQVDEVVHSFVSDISLKHGPSADDHAAPAIIMSPDKKKLIIAAAYHGSPMFIYTHDIQSYHSPTFLRSKTRLIRRLDGRYTYPRLLTDEDTIYLIARLQPTLKQKNGNSTRAGHLTIRKSTDAWRDEITLIASHDNEVIYAGTPILLENMIVVAYSTLSYADDRLHGFKLLAWNINNATQRVCDLEKTISPYAYSNRPTGIGFNGKKVRVATSYFTQTDFEARNNRENYLNKNTVAILTGSLENCETFEVTHTQQVSLPYYHTSVSVNENLDWIYFDENKVYSNLLISRCFKSSKMMYPNFTENGVVYAAMNQPYSIRDWSNSIIMCYRNIDTDKIKHINHTSGP